jgi:hypothetical protein
LPAERYDCMFTGHNSYHMAFSERKQVGKRDTFAPDDPVAIRKCRGNCHNRIAAERATPGI